MECRVRFAQRLGASLPQDIKAKSWAHYSAAEQREIQDFTIKKFETIYPDYVAISYHKMKETCGKVGGNLDLCYARLRKEDPGYLQGLSCRNAFYLKRWRDFARRSGNAAFPAKEFLENVIESRICRLDCDAAIVAKNKTAKSWFKKLLKLRGINLLKIFRRQKKRRKKVRMKHTGFIYYLEIGGSISIQRECKNVGRSVVPANFPFPLSVLPL